MAKIDSANIPAVQFTEQTAAPATPATGKWKLYHKSDGLYTLDDTGTSVGPLGTGGGGDGRTPDTPPTTANSIDDEFNLADGSAIDAKWSLWTNANSGSVSAEYVQGGAYVMVGPASGTFRRWYKQSISATTWRLRARFRFCDNETSTSAYDVANLANYASVGLICGTTSDDKWWFGGMSWTNGVPRFILKNGTGTTNGSPAGYWGEPDLMTGGIMASTGFWLEMRYTTASALQLYLSMSGHPGTFHLVSGVALPSYLSGDPTVVGFGMMNDGDVKSKIAVCDWFRRTL